MHISLSVYVFRPFSSVASSKYHIPHNKWKNHTLTKQKPTPRAFPEHVELWIFFTFSILVEVIELTRGYESWILKFVRKIPLIMASDLGKRHLMYLD